MCLKFQITLTLFNCRHNKCHKKLNDRQDQEKSLGLLLTGLSQAYRPINFKTQKQKQKNTRNTEKGKGQRNPGLETLTIQKRKNLKNGLNLTQGSEFTTEIEEDAHNNLKCKTSSYGV